MYPAKSPARSVNLRHRHSIGEAVKMVPAWCVHRGHKAIPSASHRAMLLFLARVIAQNRAERSSPRGGRRKNRSKQQSPESLKYKRRKLNPARSGNRYFREDIIIRN